MSHNENELVTVKIASQETLLGAGYVPEGRNLRGKKGDLLEAGFLNGYAGKIVSGRPTESEDYPVTVDGQILPAAAIHAEVEAVQFEEDGPVAGRAFSDGTVQINDSTYSAKQAAKLAVLFGKKSKK